MLSVNLMLDPACMLRSSSLSMHLLYIWQGLGHSNVSEQHLAATAPRCSRGAAAAEAPAAASGCWHHAMAPSARRASLLSQKIRRPAAQQKRLLQTEFQFSTVLDKFSTPVQK